MGDAQQHDYIVAAVVQLSGELSEGLVLRSFDLSAGHVRADHELDQRKIRVTGAIIMLRRVRQPHLLATTHEPGRNRHRARRQPEHGLGHDRDRIVTHDDLFDGCKHQLPV